MWGPSEAAWSSFGRLKPNSVNHLCAMNPRRIAPGREFQEDAGLCANEPCRDSIATRSSVPLRSLITATVSDDAQAGGENSVILARGAGEDAASTNGIGPDVYHYRRLFWFGIPRGPAFFVLLPWPAGAPMESAAVWHPSKLRGGC